VAVVPGRNRLLGGAGTETGEGASCDQRRAQVGSPPRALLERLQAGHTTLQCHCRITRTVRSTRYQPVVRAGIERGDSADKKLAKLEAVLGQAAGPT
jgi:hypothetical protein